MGQAPSVTLLKIRQILDERWVVITIIICIFLLICFDFFFTQTVDFLKNWKELIGAFVGAATPVGLYLIGRSYEDKKRWEDQLSLIERHLVWAINNLSDIDRMLHRFKKSHLAEYMRHIEEDDKGGRYSVGQAFIPLTPAFVLKDELLLKTTGSLYVENSLMQAIAVSKNLPIILEDLNRQFDRTLSLNTQLGLIKVNSPAQHNATLRSNLESFIAFLDTEVFGHNIPTYLRILARAKIAVSEIRQLGMEKWKQTYGAIAPSTSPEERMDQMQELFKEKTDIFIDTIQKDFDSKLVTTEEKTPYELANPI